MVAFNLRIVKVVLLPFIPFFWYCPSFHQYILFMRVLKFFYFMCVFDLEGICLGPKIVKPFLLKHGIVTMLMHPITFRDGYKEDELCVVKLAYWP
jgi:hypothetical protein